MPTHLCQSPLYFNITLSVTQNLLYPEWAVGMRNLTTFGILNLDVGCIGSNGVDVVSVPETSIYKHARPILPEYHIWLSRQARMIKPIAKPLAQRNFLTTISGLVSLPLIAAIFLLLISLALSIWSYLHIAPHSRHLQVPSQSTCMSSLPQYGQSPVSFS